MVRSLGPSPGHRKHPDHRIAIKPFSGRVTAMSGEDTLADSVNVLQLDETGYEPVLYFPASDVRLDRLQDSDSRTRCPFKGVARYYALENDGVLTDAAWFYPGTYDEVAAIAGYIAFYADRVRIDTDPNRQA